MQKNFSEYLTQIQNFRLYVKAQLLILGQIAFHLAYEYMQNRAVIDGLAHILSSNGQIEKLAPTLLPQNLPTISKKGGNFNNIEHALVKIDLFNLN